MSGRMRRAKKKLSFLMIAMLALSGMQANGGAVYGQELRMESESEKQSTEEKVLGVEAAEDENTNTPEEGVNGPGEGADTPEEGTNTPEEGGNTPEEGENTPEEGGNTPGEGGNTPEEGTNTPEEGENTPEEGENTPEEGENASEEDESVPGEADTSEKNPDVPEEDKTLTMEQPEVQPEEAEASVTTGDAAAPIYYRTLQEAWDAANQAGQPSTVTLLKNVSLNSGSGLDTENLRLENGSSITLDCGSCTLSGSGSMGGADDNRQGLIYISSGHLNLVGGTIQAATYNAVILQGASAGITVSGGTVTARSSAVRASHGAAVNVLGGTLSGSPGEGSGVSADYGASATITGGIISGHWAVDFEGGSGTISGGTITGSSMAVHLEDGASVRIEGNANVQGTGTNVCGVFLANDGCTAEISGGTIADVGTCVRTYGTGCAATVTGGSFTGGTYALYADAGTILVNPAGQIDFNGAVRAAGSKPSSIQLAGGTINIVSGNDGISAEGGGAVTVENCTVDVTVTGLWSGINAGGIIEGVEGGSLAIKGDSTKVTVQGGAKGINVDNVGNLLIESPFVTASGSDFGLYTYNSDKSNVVLYGGTYTGSNSYAVRKHKGKARTLLAEGYAYYEGSSVDAEKIVYEDRILDDWDLPKGTYTVGKCTHHWGEWIQNPATQEYQHACTLCGAEGGPSAMVKVGEDAETPFVSFDEAWAYAAQKGIDGAKAILTLVKNVETQAASLAVPGADVIFMGGEYTLYAPAAELAITDSGSFEAVNGTIQCRQITASGGNVTVGQAVIQGTDYGIYVSDGGSAEVSGGTVSGRDGLYVGSGTASISGGTFVGTEAGAAVRVPDGTTVESILSRTDPDGNPIHYGYYSFDDSVVTNTEVSQLTGTVTVKPWLLKLDEMPEDWNGTCAEKDLELRVGAESFLGGTLTYQWYQGVPGQGTPLEAATASTYQPGRLLPGTYSYYCVVTCGETSVTTSAAKVTVTAIPLTPVLQGTFTKPYDGTEAAASDVAIVLQGLLDGDDVTAVGTIAYNSADVTAANTISAQNITLSGADKEYYTLTASSLSVPGNITKADYEAPAVSAKNETIKDKNDGGITGLQSGMEYRADGSDVYTLVADPNMIFTPGIWYVRWAEDENHTLSPDTKVIVMEGRMLKITFLVDKKEYEVRETVWNGSLAQTDIPKIPSKAGYDRTPPKWSVSDFTNIQTDMTVEAVYVANPWVGPPIGPTATPTVSPTGTPTVTPPVSPTGTPTVTPPVSPTGTPAVTPPVSPTETPTVTPPVSPTGTPAVTPPVSPTGTPAVTPSVVPTETPAVTPSASPTETPVKRPTATPSGTYTPGSGTGSGGTQSGQGVPAVQGTGSSYGTGSDTPATGDTSGLPIWLAMLCLSSTAMLVASRKKAKNGKYK